MKSQNATNINKIRQELESGRDPSMISAESMEAGEKAAWKEVLLKISPTLDADEKRADIIVFLQTIISQYFKGIQVNICSIKHFHKLFNRFFSCQAIGITDFLDFVCFGSSLKMVLI